MIRTFLLLSFLTVGTVSFSQRKAKKIITPAATQKILATLSSDDMQGRRAGTPGSEKAAEFIASEFKKAGLKTFDGLNGYKQDFVMIKPTFVSISGAVDGQPVEAKNVVVFSSAKQVEISNTSGYEKRLIKPGDNFIRQAQQLIAEKKNLVIVVDTSFTKTFAVLPRLKRMMFSSPTNTVFILADREPKSFSIIFNQTIEQSKLANVVGVLPGKSKKNEYVVFSGHYDHLGIGKPMNGDSIYNGANDDASGTTAVILLAKYYKALGNNERTLIFAAFTAEEIGGYGSQYFSRQLPAEQVMAMFNIEMIGTESKWNKSSAYITGYEKTNMGTILQNNLKGSGFTFHPDPYTDQQLFYRSDNATLARLGVPAHTISTSKMDSEPNYHKASDEISTLDMNNMAEIIKAVAVSAQSIVKGTDTPSRVKVEELTR